MRYVITLYVFLISIGLVQALDPVVQVMAQDSTVDCGTPNIELILTNWYQNAGGAIATDPDGSSIIYSANLDLDEVLDLFEQSSLALCGNTKSVTVAFIAINEIGENTSVGSATFSTIDDTDPVVTQIPVSKTYECQLGLQDTLVTWIKNHGEASAQDACSEVEWTTFIYNDTDGNSGVGSIDNGPYPEIMSSCQTTINMSFVFEDECGNERATTGSFTIIDDTPPLIENLPREITVSCDNIPADEDVIVSDFCDPNVSVSIEQEDTQTGNETDCSYYNYTITKIFTAEDDCGNTSIDTITIQVADLGPPIVNGLDSINISCEEFANGDTLLLTAIDDCSMVNISYTDVTSEGSCITLIDREYKINDVCGNEVLFNQHIIVQDITPPSYVSLPNDGTITCDEIDQETAFQQWLSTNLELNIIDGCSEATIFAATPGSYDLEDVSTFPGQSVGTFDNSICPSPISGYLRSELVDFVIYDDCGNTAVHQAVFGIVDNTPPQITSCASDIQVVLEPGKCHADITIDPLNINDDCTGEYVGSLTLSDGTMWTIDPYTSNVISDIPEGMYSAIIQITDCAGNQATCEFTIIILDQENPIFDSCPSDFELDISDSECTYSYMIPLDDIVVRDNCLFEKNYNQKRPELFPNQLLKFSTSSGTPRIGNETYTFEEVFPIFFTTKPVSLSLEIVADIDGENNYFTIFGEEGYEIGVTTPATSCVRSTFEFNIPVNIFNSWLDDNNVDITLIANSDNSIMPCGSLGSDGTDGVSTASISLKYDDARIRCSVNGATTINVQDLVDTTMLELNVGQNSINLSTSDNSGNESTCTYFVNIVDVTPPIALCKNAVIKIHPDGEHITLLSPEDINNGSTDMCSVVSLSVEPSEFSCHQTGSEVEVTLFVTDVSSNMDNCTATVKVEPYDLMPYFSSGVCQDDTLKLFSNAPEPTTPGAYTYNWSGPNFTSSEANPYIIGATVDNNGTYNVTITGFNGCQTEGSVQVVIPALTTPELTADSDTICFGESLVLSATAFTGNITYDWYEGTSENGVLIASTMDPSLVLEPDVGSHSYTVVAVSENCSSNPSSILSTLVTIAPIADVNDNFINICEGESFSLGTSSFGAGYTYQWTGPDGYFSDKPLPEEIENVSLANEGEYSLIISVGSCQSDTVLTRVNVFDKPATPMITSGETFCEGSTVSLTVNNIPNGDLYKWYLDGTLFVTEDDNSLVIQNAQASNSGSWQVTVQDGLCTSDTSEAQNIVIEDLQDISVTNSGPVCQGDSVQLFVSFIAGANYQWTGPENFSSDKQNPKLLAIAGDYTVEIVTGTNCESSASTTVIVNTAPVITALSNNSMTCMDGETNIVFFPTIVPTNGDYDFQWSGPNGFMSEELNPTIVNPTEADNGTYELVVNNENCSSQIAESIVDITIIPKKPSIILPIISCLGSTVELTCSVSAPDYTYIWKTPNSTVTTSLPVLELVAIDNSFEGEYTVTIETGECISEESDVVEFTVTNQSIVPEFTTNSPVCHGDDIILKIVNPVPGATYLWSGPTNISSTSSEITITNVDQGAAGQYSVAINDNGCMSENAPSQNIIVQDMVLTPQPEFEVYDVCIGITTGIEICIESSSAEPGAVYTLTNINNNNIVAAGSSICYIIDDFSLFDGGTNFLKWTSNLDGCMSEESQQFRVDLSDAPSTKANILEEDISICLDEGITLNSQHGEPLVDVSWYSFDAVAISTPDQKTTFVSGFKNGKNTIILSYSQNACVEYSRDTVTITLEGIPVVNDDNFTLNSRNDIDLEIFENDELPEQFLLTIVEQPQIGTLTIEDNIITYTPDDVVSGKVHFTYQICNAVCPDNCSEGTVQLDISVDDSCVASTIITPNDDGINDFLEVTCLENNTNIDSKLVVFNQWGDEVYSANNYRNNWSGTFEGKPLPAGTYFYILDLGTGRDPIHSFIIIQR